MFGLKFIPRGIPEIKEFAGRFARGLRGVIIETVVKYIIGNEAHGLRHAPPYKFVSRAEAYGKVSDAPEGYFSWPQFRLVKAKQAQGKTGHNQRTGELAMGWMQKGEGAQSYAENASRIAPYAFGKPGVQQARQLGRVGWRYYMETALSNMAGALRAAQAAVRKIIENRGKT